MKSLIIALITVPFVIILTKAIDQSIVHTTQIIHFTH